MQNKLITAFFGDGKWAHNTLKKIIYNKKIEIKIVILRKSPDKEIQNFCKKFKIKCLIFNNVNSNKAFLEFKKLGTNFGISVSYDQIFKKKIMNLFQYGIINFHAGNLPFYRGRSPINWAIINGENFIGLTVHFIDKNIDTGDIIYQRKLKISKIDDFKKVILKVYKLSPSLVEKAIYLISKNKVNRIKQKNIHNYGSYYKKRKLGDENICWSKSSLEIFNLIRGICKPGVMARTFNKKKNIIKINKASNNFKNMEKNIKVGTVIKKSKNFFIVKTGDRSIKIIDWYGRVKAGEVLR